MSKNINSSNKSKSNANNSSKNSGTVITVSVTTTFTLGSEDIPKEYEAMIFRGVERRLRSFTIPSFLAEAIIEPIKVSMSKDKSKNADFLGYLEVTEKTSHDLELDKIFSYLPTQEKYRLIDSIFERLDLKDERVDFILRQESILPININKNK